MFGNSSNTNDDSVNPHERALTRWDNEGGAQPNGPQEAASSVDAEVSTPENDLPEVL
jgi:hypothetical protein